MKGTIVFDFDYTLADTSRFKEVLAVAEADSDVIERMPEFMFPGAVSLLSRLKADDWNLTLVTIGEPSWQKRKVVSSGIQGYFSDILYTDSPKESHSSTYATWPQPLVFINDNGGELDALSQILPHARCIAVAGPKPLPSDPEVPVCRSLEEVYNVITKM